MKQIKLYNVIFPLWFVLFLPPVILITLMGNFVIDSLVILVCYFVFKLSKIQMTLKKFYGGSILKVWLFGFLADFIGAFVLFLISFGGDFLGLPYEITSAIEYDAFKHPAAFIIVLFAMIVSGALIFIFNYYFTFKSQIEDRKLRFKAAITLAIITIPWTFLLPTKWFYSGF